MFIKNALTYSGINFLSQIILFIKDLILRNILPPQIMGVWNFVGVARGFVSPFSIGILSGTLRELPIARGRQDEEAQGACRAVSLTYSLIEVALVAGCVVLYALSRKDVVPYDEYLAILLTAVLITFTRFQESYVTFFQGAQLYVPLSRVLFINSAILAVCLPIGAITMGLWGVFLAALLAEALKALWMGLVAGKFGLRSTLRWNTQLFKKLASYSIPYKVANYPFTLFMMIDLLWITKFADMKSLAIYAMARSFFFRAQRLQSGLAPCS